MNKFYRFLNGLRLLLSLCLGAVCLLNAAVAAAAPVKGLRASVSPARVRFVLDSAQEIKFKHFKEGKVITVEMAESAAAVPQPRPQVQDAAIKSVRLQSSGRDGSKLTIVLNKDCQYKVYRLPQPERLVVDIYRITILKQSQQLAKGVEYTFYQDELDGRQIQAYAVTLAPGAAYELHPFSAAGTYNGRGYVSRIAQQERLLVAINSSYFDADGWVIGNTKYRDNFISADFTPRSALTLGKNAAGVAQDTVYSGTVRFPDGSSAVLKGMNRVRLANDFVLYNEYYAPSTKTNQWGAEAKVDKATGKVLAVSAKGNMAITPGTYVLSGHGAQKEALLRLKKGDRIALKESLGSSEADQAETVISGGPLLLQDGRVKVRMTEERIAKDIAAGRSPRTAVGVKKDGSLILLVVDGRSSASAGMTLNELARYLLRLGARDAVNFDGGGSSVMAVRGKVVNRPSDGRERAVSMGLGLFPKLN